MLTITRDSVRASLNISVSDAQGWDIAHGLIRVFDEDGVSWTGYPVNAVFRVEYTKTDEDEVYPEDVIENPMAQNPVEQQHEPGDGEEQAPAEDDGCR